MRGANWSRVPSVFLSCLCSCLLWPVVPGSETSTTQTARNVSHHTSPFSVATTAASTAYLSNVPTSTDTNENKLQSFFTASSQSNFTESRESSQKGETSMVTGMSTAAPSPLTSGHNATSHVPRETSYSTETTSSSHSSDSPTHLRTSQMTAPTSTTLYNVGKTDHLSLSVTTTITTVTSAVSETTEGSGNTTASSFSTSTHNTPASSQSHFTESRETSLKAETSTVPGVSTSAASSSPSGTIVTSHIPQDTSYSAAITTSSNPSVTHTYLSTSQMTTAPPSTSTAPGKREDRSLSGTTTSTAVTTAVSETPEGSGNTTASSFSTSTHNTPASSQSHFTESRETSLKAETGTVPGVSTSAASSSPSGTIVTSHVPQDTSYSAATTTSSNPSVTHTYLSTSQMTTAPPSTSTAPGKTQDRSLSGTTTSTAVTTAVSETTEGSGNTTASSFSISTQNIPASSQSHITGSRETSQKAETGTILGVKTSAPSSSPSGTIVTSHVPQDTSYSAATTTSSNPSVTHTYLSTSQMMTAPPSTSTAPGKTQDRSLSGTTTSTAVTTAVSETTEGSGNTTASSFSISTQNIPASSQSHITGSRETSQKAETGTVPGVSTSAPSSSPSGTIVTSHVPQDTSYSATTTTTSNPSVTHTYLSTSQMTTAPPSTSTAPGKTQDRSLSGTTTSTAVTTAVSETTEGSGNTTASSFSISTQNIPASSQSHITGSRETSQKAETGTILGVKTSAPSSSPSGTIVTSHVPQDTSYSAATTTSSNPSVTHTYLSTSQMTTAPPSTSTAPGKTQDRSLSGTTTSTAVTTAVSETTEGSGNTTASSFSISTQNIPASSQSHITGSRETSQKAETGTVPGVSTSAPSSSPSGTIVTSYVPQETSYSATTTTTSNPSVTHTYLSTSQMTTAPPSTYTAPGKREDRSLSGTTTSTAVTTAVSETTEGSGNTTASSFSTSTHNTPASSQSHFTESRETSQKAETSTVPGVSTSAPSSSPSGTIVTSHVPQDRSYSATTTTTSNPSVTHTYLSTSQMMTAPPSTSTAPGKTQDRSLSGTTTSTAVTTGVSETTEGSGNTTASSFSISTQNIPASSQSHITGSRETSQKAETGTVPGVSTSAPSSSPSGTIVTSHVPQDTSYSAATTTSSNPSVTHTYLSTSQMTTAPPSTSTSPGKTQDRSLSGTTTSTAVTTAVSETTEGSGNTTASSFSTSPQNVPASSQKHFTESRETSLKAETGTIPGVKTSAPSSSPSGTIVTSHVPQDTSYSAATTTSSNPSVTHTYLSTSQMTTAPPSTSTAPGKTQDRSLSGTTTSTAVTTGVSETTEGNGNTTASSFSISTQNIPASSQSHITGSRETSQKAETGTMPGVSTSAPSSSPSGTIVTSHVPQDTSYSAATTTSSNPSVTHTYLSTSQMTTAPPSTSTAPGKTQDRSLSETTTSTAVTTGVSERTEGSGNTTASSFSISTQNVPASSQKHFTESRETTKKGETSMVTRLSTTAPSSLPSGNNIISPVPQETSYTAPGPAVTWNSTTIFTDHPTLLSDISTFSPSTVRSSSTVKTETSGAITTSLRTDSEKSTATSLPSTTSQTLITSTPSTSTGTHSTVTPVPINPEKGVSLFPYGPHVGDQEFVRRKADFTSPLFKPQIGFPFGSSLRDFLYFTDNGQIIFPESEYQIFAYPIPPLRGFTDRDQLAIVAPFWDDADFSSHKGTIFYQEYETLYDDYKPPVVQQVESWIKKFTNTWNYKARWTLKVTWVNASAYPAQWTYGTSTYQAILSTDGSRSFTLFLYQSGGMQWDVTQHPGNWVLMGFSSGDGYYKNSPLTFQPAWEKYRPDQFLNSNSGPKGLQVYNLHSREKPNYRLRCLQRLKRQPQLPSLDWDHISCPCSWQQGLWDLRFQPIHIGWWGLSSRQLCSFSSWRGGVCCSYGPWGELLQGWRVQSLWQLEQELELQDCCCRKTDHSSFCALYHQRQPRISCAWYQPPRPAWMFGDPHITTLDGANYTFNGLGDFLLVRARDGNSSFLLQGRTAQTGSARATNFIAFAAQYNTSSLAPITIQWLLEPNDRVHVWLNNQTVTFEDGEDQEIFNTTGVVMNRNGSLVSASLDGTVIVSVIALSNILHASCSLPEEYRNHTEGLLGVWNDSPGDDFKMPNGTVIPQGSTEEELFHYGMTWEINGTSLLGKRDNHLPSNFTPVFFDDLLQNGSLTSGCNGDKQCIYDTLATGNTETGLHTEMLLRRYQEMNNTLNQYPPSIDGSQELRAHVGSTEWIHYKSKSKDVTFTLRNNNTDDFKLFENGTLLWTPSLLKPFTLEILARSARDNLSSVLQPKTVVCACKEKKQCLYNQTRWVGNSSLEVAGCKCDNNNFGHYCERSKDLCDEQCFPNVKCIPGQGCEACPSNLTGDGRHCAPPQYYELCQNTSCPVNYCYNQGHCYISQTLGCQATCTCPPAFTDARCFLAGNNFTPTLKSELPLRTIQIFLSEEENASAEEVNTSVAYRLENLDVRAFVLNSEVEKIGRPVALTSGKSLQQWRVVSKFQYRLWGPVIDFLNTRLLDAVVEAFLLQAPRGRWKRSEGPRNNVVFNTISRRDVHSLRAWNVSILRTYLKCSGYKGYKLVYSLQGGFTCMSPCSEGYCEHGGQCQHLPDGPHCSCVPFSIYMPWGKHCEHLSMKLGAFFGILFGALGALLLLGVIAFVVLHFWRSRVQYSYPLDSES